MDGDESVRECSTSGGSVCGRQDGDGGGGNGDGDDDDGGDDNVASLSFFT